MYQAAMPKKTLRALAAVRTSKARRNLLRLDHAQEFMADVFGENLHAKRVLSLSNGLAGVLQAAVLSVHAIGMAYAKLNRSAPKHGIKQVDRMLSNGGLAVSELQRQWCLFVLGDQREDVVIALDWTDFDDDDHTTLCAYLVTNHGRATPLAWRTIKKSELEGQRTAAEHDMVERLDGWFPTKIQVTLLADRGFGDQKLYGLLQFLNWDYVIRFRGNILVESAEGETRMAAEC